MTPDFLPLFATIILLFPMGYLLLTAPAFLLVRLNNPVVAQLMRGMFNGYFLMLAIAGGVATLVFAATARLGPAVCMALAVGLAIVARRWFLGQMDSARAADDAGGVPSPAPFACWRHAGESGPVCRRGLDSAAGRLNRREFRTSRISAAPALSGSARCARLP